MTTNNGTIKSYFSVHLCKHQLLDQLLAQLSTFTYSAYNTAAMKSTPLNEEIKHRRTTTYFVIFKVNTLCTFLFSSILYTNRLLVYPSAREALAKKINISCV